jgi:hypothetical protein
MQDRAPSCIRLANPVEPVHEQISRVGLVDTSSNVINNLGLNFKGTFTVHPSIKYQISKDDKSTRK